MRRNPAVATSDTAYVTPTWRACQSISIKGVTLSPGFSESGCQYVSCRTASKSVEGSRAAVTDSMP